MTVTKDRIFGLDLLRCVAILFVLLAHTVFMLPLSEEDKYYLLMYFGVMGVEFFFVLSGYLVGKILLELFAKQGASARTIRYFWIRRWFRTLPAYYLTLLIYGAIQYTIDRSIIFTEPAYLVYFVFLQNFFHGPPELFRHSWSLSVEEWFYLSLPLWMFFFQRYIKKMSTLNVIIAGIVLFVLVRIIGVLLYNPDWNLGARTMVPLRLDSLMIGVLAAYLHLHHSDKWIKYSRVCGIMGLLIFAVTSVWLYVGVIMVRPEGEEHFLSKTLLFTVLSISIALWMPWLSSVQKAPGRYIGYVVTHISIVSYSLYLIHEVAMSVYFVFCYKLPLPNTILVKFVGSWIVSIGAATLMYYLFEKPFTNLRERFRLRKTSIQNAS